MHIGNGIMLVAVAAAQVLALNVVGATHKVDSIGLKDESLENEDKAYGALNGQIVERIRLWPGLAPRETESSPGCYAVRVHSPL